jgi:hypothetical protein
MTFLGYPNSLKHIIILGDLSDQTTQNIILLLKIVHISAMQT